MAEREGGGYATGLNRAFHAILCSWNDSTISQKKNSRNTRTHTHVRMYIYICVYIIRRGVVFLLHRVDRVLWMVGKDRITEIEILGKWEEEVTKGWMLNEQPIERWSMVLRIFFFFLTVMVDGNYLWISRIDIVYRASKLYLLVLIFWRIGFRCRRFHRIESFSSIQ